MKKFLLPLLMILISAFVISCSSLDRTSIKQKYHLGVDASWYPYEFKGEQANINGFLEELLLEVSKMNNIEIIRIDANWDTLFEKMQSKEDAKPSYEVVISMKEPHNFNLEHYLFSSIFLETGPVIVKEKTSSYDSLKDLEHKRIGVCQNNLIVPILQKNSNVLVLSYTSVAGVLNELEKKKIEAAVIPQIFAISYLKNIYPNQFSYSKPLFEEGLRFIAEKNNSQGQAFIEMINKSLKELDHTGTLSSLKKKWNLE
jgi:ABC-type amino acid transport substrate-binding protein